MQLLNIFSPAGPRGRQAYTTRPLFAVLLVAIGLTACNKDVQNSGPLHPSPAAALSRYDLAKADYDVQPVTGFVYAYDSANHVTDVFEKSGQTLSAFSLSYTGSRYTQATDNHLGKQSFSYNADGRLQQIDYNNPTDTGKQVFGYDAGGLLLSVVDSVKKPNLLPIITQYLFTYDGARQNVVKITRNRLDLEGRPTLLAYDFYTFDDKANPFRGVPALPDAYLLPGGIPALVNKNNIVQSRIVGTILKTSGGGTSAHLDTLTNVLSSRQYTYNAGGWPVGCRESFQDLQYNYSGNRTFTYDY